MTLKNLDKTKCWVKNAVKNVQLKVGLKFEITFFTQIWFQTTQHSLQ